MAVSQIYYIFWGNKITCVVFFNNNPYNIYIVFYYIGKTVKARYKHFFDGEAAGLLIATAFRSFLSNLRKIFGDYCLKKLFFSAGKIMVQESVCQFGLMAYGPHRGAVIAVFGKKRFCGGQQLLFRFFRLFLS